MRERKSRIFSAKRQAVWLETHSDHRLAMITAYDYSIARLMDDAADAILVGDSLGMVMMGLEDTLSVGMDDMIHHCAAVARAAQKALVVCDMPFMSYQVSPQQACENAGRLVREGRAQAVKLEGGAEFAPHVEAIVRASIPVMGHIGLTPQSLHSLGGYKVQGKSAEAAQKMLDDARALEKAGAFALVLECVPTPLATRITQEISIPTIGIGAGPGCDGQVQVWHDVLGLFQQFTPKHARRYAELGKLTEQALAAYVADVKHGTFPGPENSF